MIGHGTIYFFLLGITLVLSKQCRLYALGSADDRDPALRRLLDTPAVSTISTIVADVNS